MMLQPPRGREVSFYEWEGRGEEGDGTAQMPRLFLSFLFFPLPLLFVNGRAERLGRAEMRRLHFYEWGGLRMVLRRRDAEIFMNGKKWRMRRVSVRERGVRGRGVGFFFPHKGNVRADLHKEWIYFPEVPLRLYFNLLVYLISWFLRVFRGQWSYCERISVPILSLQLFCFVTKV